jgi:hypothetical protein
LLIIFYGVNMTRGKKLIPPQIRIVPAEHPRYSSLDEAWQVVGPLLAQLLAEMIKRDKANQGKKGNIMKPKKQVDVQNE